MSEASQDNIYTLGIAKFVSGLQNEAITEQVRERIKLLILDSLGCALYGSHLEWCRIIQDTLTRVDQIRDCAVWGTKNRLSTPHAALVNGTEVQGFELDDVHRAGVLHVGAVVLPASSMYWNQSTSDFVQRFRARLIDSICPSSPLVLAKSGKPWRSH